ncbi:hypothetical protein [Ramlibacter sp. PS4R-6]|uniref:hypothetical protein n=1 Tax=Ramlibacter sp. PS4R-6 TaxID=3133438 RepID=UPI0030AA662F
MIRIAMLIGLATICFATSAARTDSRELDKVDQRVQQLQQELGEQKRALQTTAENVDKRLADFATLATMQGTHTAWVANLIAVLAIGATILVFLASFITYISATEKAKREAKDWFEKNESKLKEQIATLVAQAEESSRQIKESRERVETEAEAARQAFQNAKDRQAAKVEEGKAPLQNASSEPLTAAAQQAKAPARTNLDELPEAPLRQGVALELGARIEAAFQAGNRGNRKEEIAMYQAIDRDFRGDESDHVQVQLMRVKFMCAITLIQTDSIEQGLVYLEELIARDTPDIATDRAIVIARSYISKASALRKLQRNEEEASTLEALIRRFRTDAETEIRLIVLQALLAKALNQFRAGNRDAEVTAYSEIIDLAPDSTENSEINDVVLKALVFKAGTLGKLGDLAQAIDLYDKALTKHGSVQDIAQRRLIANAMLRKAGAVGKLGNRFKEIEIYKQIQEKFKGEADAEIELAFARAMYFEALTYGQTKEPEKEVSAYERFLAQFGGSNRPEMREMTAKAMFYKGFTLAQMSKHDDAIRVFEEVESRFGKEDVLTIQQTVSNALLQKAFSLQALSRSDDEIRAYDAIAERYSGVPALRKDVLFSIYMKILSLRALGKTAEAAAARQAALAEYKEGESAEIANHVQKIRSLE